MARQHPLTWLDVCTRERLTGNQLAVVHDADALDDATMAAFARETRLSETTFVQTATAAGADYRNRIFMMSGELPFAGHPSLGTAVAVALARGETSASYVQQTPAGLQPIDVEVLDDGLASASMLQEPVTFGEELDPARVAAAVRIDPDRLHPELPPQLVSTGAWQVIAPVAPGTLAAVVPDAEALAALIEATGVVTLYLAELDLDGAATRCRSFFVDPGGVTEDPATGSAAGPLLAYLHERRGLERLHVVQAVEMGRRAEMACAVEGDRIRVGGGAVVVATGTVWL